MKRIFWGGIKLEIIEYFTTKKKEQKTTPVETTKKSTVKSTLYIV